MDLGTRTLRGPTQTLTRSLRVRRGFAISLNLDRPKRRNSGGLFLRTMHSKGPSDPSVASLSSVAETTLRIVTDTFVPRVVEGTGQLFGPSASELGVDRELARIVLEYFSPEQRADFLRFLRVLESRWTNLFLSGQWVRFSRLPAIEREEFLRSWARSRLPVKRQGFHVVKRLTLFLYYARSQNGEDNPTWDSLGYLPSPRRGVPSQWGGPVPDAVVRPEQETDVEADVCVVGSGAGGAVIAARLAAAGAKVVILEAGGWWTAATFPQREAEAFDTLFQAHGLQTTADLAIAILAGVSAGGSTAINWMTCLRPSEHVRAEWERDGGMRGISSPGFDATLDAIETRLNVGTDDSQINPANEVLRRGCLRLGLIEGRDFEVLRRNARGCQRRCDYCGFGCVYDAKQSTLITFLPDAFAYGARIFCNTRAETLDIEGGRVRGVQARYQVGEKSWPVHVRARVVVVAGSAVQTPALLLRSGIKFAGVGHGLRLHPTTALVGEYSDPVRMWSGPMQTIAVRKFIRIDSGEHGPWMEAVPAHPGLAGLAFPWSGAMDHRERMRRVAYAAPTIILVRDTGHGRVALDSRGDPVLHYRLTSEDRQHLVRGLIETARIHHAAGARRLTTLHLDSVSVGDGQQELLPQEFDTFLAEIERRGVRENAIGLFSAHPTGSSRAGTDPRTSTALPTGECHEVENLWIGDGSLLPTAAGVNPMISIMAVAHRTADFILERGYHPLP